MATCLKILHIADNGQNPITKETDIAAVTKVLKTSGVFETAINEWDFKLAADQTYLNLVNHFTAANKERQQKLTAGQAGYHGSNSAMTDALKNALNQVEATTAASKAATSAAFETTYNNTSNRKTAVNDNTFK